MSGGRVNDISFTETFLKGNVKAIWKGLNKKKAKEAT
jgi:hypothetical protein